MPENSPTNELNLDNINIRVESKLGDSVKNLNKLKNALKTLDDISQRADFSNLENQIRKFETINLSRISEQVSAIQSAISYLNRMPKPEKVFSEDFAENIEQTTETMSRIKDAAVPLQQTTVVLDDVAETAASTARTFSWLADELDENAGALIQIDNTAKDAGGSIGLLSLLTRNAGKEAEKSAGRLGKFYESLKRIALYRVVRSILKHIADAFKSGMQTIAQYSDEANAALSRIKTSSTYLKNSLGAMLAPVLSAIAPLIKTVADGLVSVANNLNMMFAAMRGQKTYTKAIEYWQDYTDAVNAAKAATIGIDELNVIGGKQGSVPVADMFETAEVGELSGFYNELKNTIEWVGDHIGVIALSLGAIAGIKIFTAAAGWVTGIDNFVEKALGAVGRLSPFLKAVTGAAGVVGAFLLAKEGAEELTRYISGDDSASLTGALFSLVGGATLAAIGGAALGGPIGAVIAGLGYVAGSMIGVMLAQREMRLKNLRDEFYAGATSIETITEKMKSYFEALDFDKQGEWITSINNAKKAYESADKKFGVMWDTLKDREELKPDDIVALGDAFNSLADAAKNLNEVKFNSLMSGISTAITNNLTPALNQQLGDLYGKIYDLKILSDSAITGISAEMQGLLGDIAASGGKVTSEQRAKLADYRKQLSAYTLTPDVSYYTMEYSLGELIKGGISAGESGAEVKSKIGGLADVIDTYKKTMLDKFIEDKATLATAIQLDKTQFGGALGFSEADLKTLETSYQANLDVLDDKFNDVINQLISQYKKSENYFTRSALETAFDAEYNAAKAKYTQEQMWHYESLLGQKYEPLFALADEAQDVIKFLESQKRKIVTATENTAQPAQKVYQYGITTRAGGGLVPRGDIFVANEKGEPELVGKFGDSSAVANPNMIVDGIKRGVTEAGIEERALLREQNSILRALLDKDASIHIGDDAIGKANARYARSRGVEVSKGVFAGEY